MPSLSARDLASALAVVIACLASSQGFACPYSIRDSAFIGRGSARPYRLVISFDTALGPDARRRLESATERVARDELADANITLELVPRDLAKARETGARRSPSPLPAALQEELATAAPGIHAHLVAPDGRSLALGSLGLDEGSEEFEDRAKQSLGALSRIAVESPVRSRLVERLVDDWCAVLLIASPERSSALGRSLRPVARSLVGQATEMGKTMGETLWLDIDPADPLERVLLFSLGTPLDSREAASSPEFSGAARERLVVIAGRGETRGPTLEGDAITPDALREILVTLGRSCSCTTSSDWLIGHAIPMRWRSSDAARAREALGFDPLDPDVLEKIRGDGRGRPEALVGLDGFDLGLGYEEISLEPLELETPLAAATDSPTKASLRDIDAPEADAPEADAPEAGADGAASVETESAGAALEAPGPAGNSGSRDAPDDESGAEASTPAGAVRLGTRLVLLFVLLVGAAVTASVLLLASSERKQRKPEERDP